MRVIHVLPAIAEEASGPSYSVVRLCESLIARGQDLTLAVMDWSRLPSVHKFVRAFPMGFGPRRLGRSPKMRRWLIRQTSGGNTDVVHNHCLWQMNSVYPAWAVKGSRTKLIVSPRGALSTWALSHGSKFKKMFWPLMQSPALASASCFHATADAEYDEIRRLGFRQPIAVIPNGIDIPELARESSSGFRNLLFLGRIHPIKGVDVLLRAWAGVMDRFPDWRLSIVGTDVAYSAKIGYLNEMKELAASLNLQRVEFSAPLYGEAKLSAYREAELFVLPSHSENFGLTVAEALAAGTPAIVAKGAPWRGLETHRCGWWIDFGADALRSSLEDALSRSPEDLAERGVNGREWMIREFSWQNVAGDVDQVYRWLIQGGHVPSSVRVN